MSEDRDPAEGEEPSETYDASDPAQIKERRRRASITESNKIRFLGYFLGDPLGRALLWEILGLQTAMGPKFGPTERLTDHMAGEREHAWQTLRYCLRKQPNLAAQMIAENDNG